MDKIIIYLGNLMHPKTVREIAVPLGISCIASYIKKQFGNLVDIKLYIDSEKLVKDVKESPPHILGLSFFLWNSNLTLKTMEYCNSLSPFTLNVLGGPNLARLTDKPEKLLMIHKYLDVLVLDQGELCFSNIVKRFNAAKFSKEKLSVESIAGCAVRGVQGFLRGTYVPEIALNVNDIPSPYLEGYLDEFLEAGCIPAIEGNRGCPFKCRYCNQADQYYSKLRLFDEARFYEELNYIHAHSYRKELIITDNNLGIFAERDHRLAMYMLDMYKRTGFPLVIAYSSSKVKSDSCIEVMKIMAKISGVFTLGLQTLTEDVLKKTERNNLSHEDLVMLCDFARVNKIRITADMIFGLPGETLASFIDSIAKVIELGVEAPQTRNLKMIPGSPLSDFDREKYQYITKFRAVSNAYGEYHFAGNEQYIRIIETEEIAYQTVDFDENDFFIMRQYVFLVELLLSYGAYSDTFKFLSARGINASKVIQYVLSQYRKFDSLKCIMERYRNYAKAELFDTEETLLATVTGSDEIWVDLMNNKDRFFKINIAFCGYILLHDDTPLEDLGTLIVEYGRKNLTGEDMHDLLLVMQYDESHRLVINKKTDDRYLLSADEIKGVIVRDEEYDFLGWITSHFSGSLFSYRYPHSRVQSYYLEQEDRLRKSIVVHRNYSCLLFYERVLLDMQQAIRRRQTTSNL